MPTSPRKAKGKGHHRRSSSLVTLALVLLASQQQAVNAIPTGQQPSAAVLSSEKSGSGLLQDVSTQIPLGEATMASSWPTAPFPKQDDTLRKIKRQEPSAVASATSS
jgi:hypothetical protein